MEKKASSFELCQNVKTQINGHSFFWVGRGNERRFGNGHVAQFEVEVTPSATAEIQSRSLMSGRRTRTLDSPFVAFQIRKNHKFLITRIFSDEHI